jgi:hypothetical protein
MCNIFSELLLLGAVKHIQKLFNLTKIFMSIMDFSPGPGNESTAAHPQHLPKNRYAINVFFSPNSQKSLCHPICASPVENLRTQLGRNGTTHQQ